MSDPFPGLPRRVLFMDVTKTRERTKPWSPVPAAMKPEPVTKPVTKPSVTKLKDVTKPTKLVTKPMDVTKPALVTKPRGGRPSKSDKPMTSAERVRLHRAAKKLG